MKICCNKVILIIFLFVSVAFVSCEKTQPKQKIKPANITVLLDLSNRIDNGQSERDLKVLNNFKDWFYRRQKENFFETNDKLKVLFHPQITQDIIPNIDDLQNNLIYDLSVNNIIQKTEVKKTLKQMRDSVWNYSLFEIYKKSLYLGKTSKWLGSDIHGFFDHDVDNYAICDSCKNILIILTDGYLNYIPTHNSKSPSVESNWFEKDVLDRFPNFALINTRKQNSKALDNLKILVLEVNKDNNQFDKIEKILTDWFVSMGIKENNIKILPTDLPANTKQVIENFLNND